MLENLLAVLLSLAIVIRSIRYLIKTSKILNKGVLVEGKVIGTKKMPLYFKEKEFPLIEYTTTSGKTIKGVFKPAWLFKTYNAEKKVLVIYDSTKPASFFIDNRAVDLINFGMLSLGITILMLAIFKLSNIA